MFWIIAIACFVVLAVLSFLMELLNNKMGVKRDTSELSGWVSFCIFCVCVAIFFFVIGLGKGMLAHTWQIDDSEDVVKIERFETIYKKRAELLTRKFAYYLAEIYPNLEKNIFEKISSKDVDIYLVKYPNLRSSETITKLVEQILSLEDDYYNQKLKKAEILKDLRYRLRSPWNYQWMMPNVDIPKE